MPDPSPGQPAEPLPDSHGAERQEISLLRAQLQALASLGAFSGPSAPAAPSQDAKAELDLLRDQLKAMAALVTAAPDRPQAAPAATPWGGEEAVLLRGILRALLDDMDRLAPRLPAVPPASPQPVAPGMAEVEAAIARLLADLVQETDRRIRAESDAMQARATLRAHGLEDRPAPHRSPVAARRS